MVRAVPFGEGFIDYEAFFAGLAEGGFDGLANYEMCSPVRGGGSLENLDGMRRGYFNGCASSTRSALGSLQAELPRRLSVAWRRASAAHG